MQRCTVHYSVWTEVYFSTRDGFDQQLLKMKRKMHLQEENRNCQLGTDIHVEAMLAPSTISNLTLCHNLFYFRYNYGNPHIESVILLWGSNMDIRILNGEWGSV